MPSIMIVDDDDLAAEQTSNILIEAGLPCGWLTDPIEALGRMRWRRPDLLLLDHDMPQLTGREMLREMRRSPELYDLPVIMLTAMQGEHDEHSARHAGAQDYIRKPFDARYLLMKVRRQLDARAHRPQHRTLDEIMQPDKLRPTMTPPQRRSVC